MNRRLAAGAAVAVLALAGCGGSSGMSAKQAGAQVHADTVAAGLSSASGLDGEAAAFQQIADRMRSQQWPSYAQTDIRDIEARADEAKRHLAADDLGDATVDFTTLGQDVDALAATLKAHGDTNISS